MGNEARKESLRYLFDRVVRPLGYKFTPDEELVDYLLEAGGQDWSRTSARRSAPARGAPACAPRTCRSCCPCIPFHRAHFDAMKRCWCGLFVHLDVTDPDSLPQFPPDEV